MYLDATYIAKFYVNESDSKAVRAVIEQADVLLSPAWSLAEVTCVFHRHRREGSLTDVQFRELLKALFDHVDAHAWRIVPVSETLLRRMGAMVSATPAGLNLRSWGCLRRMLAAAPHFGLIGRTASAGQAYWRYPHQFRM